MTQKHAETVLQEAQRLVHGDRGAAYGHPFDDYAATSAMWRAMIQRRYGVDIEITPDFACLMMVAVKLSREAGKPKRDNRVDGPGYFECADMCIEEGERRDKIESIAPKVLADVFSFDEVAPISPEAWGRLGGPLTFAPKGDPDAFTFRDSRGTPGMERVGSSLKPEKKS